MSPVQLSFNARKSLCNHLGEAAGNELADLLRELQARLESVERNKVDVTPIVPNGMGVPLDRHPAAG